MKSVELDSILDRIKLKNTTRIGYVLPLIISIPPKTAWGGLMTVPFFVYLVMMMFNLTENPPLPNYFAWTTIVQIAAILFLIWSVVYLRKEKTEGLVTSGPYRFVRHPQYLSVIILSTFMTTHRNRVGFLIPFFKYKSYSVEMLSGIIIPYAILEILLSLTALTA
jgi:hypothetical protein